MTNTTGVQSSSPDRRNRFIVYLLLGAVSVSAVKDLSRVQELATWIHAKFAPVYASSRPADRDCTRSRLHRILSERFDKTTPPAPDQSAQSNAMVNNEPEIGGEIAMAPFKARRSCSLALRSRATEQRTTAVHLDKRTLVVLAARVAKSNWPRVLEFKALSRSVMVELPPPPITKVDADTADADASPDAPLSPVGRVSRRHFSNSEHELNLKTLNGIVRFRRAS